MNTKKLMNMLAGETISAKDIVGVEETIIFADIVEDEHGTPVAYFVTDDKRVISGIARKIIRSCKLLCKYSKPSEKTPVVIRFIEQPYNEEGDTLLTFEVVEDENEIEVTEDE